MSPLVRQRVVPLAGFAVLVALVLWWFHGHPGIISDRAILLYIGCVYALAAVVMLLGTASFWSPRALGLLGTLCGDAALYFWFAKPQFGWRRFGPWEQDLIRALLATGGTLLLIGLAWWVGQSARAWVRVRRGTVPRPVEYERRSMRDRRAGWGRLPRETNGG